MRQSRGRASKASVALLAVVSYGVLGGVGTTSTADGAVAARRLPALRVVPKPAHGSKAASMGTAGGRIRVVTPSGVAVTLVVPSGALASTTTITVTPLKAVKRVPFRRGVAGAVRLAPEGLVLATPARLTFHPRHAVSRRLQTPFAATGDGRSFHIYPGRAGRKMSVSILHFSVYGEGEASQAEQRREGRRAQTSPGAAVERDQAASASDRRTAADLEDLAQTTADAVTAAMTDDSRVGTAVDDALTLGEELRLVGWSSDVLALGDELPGSVDGHLRQLLDQIRASFPGPLLDRALASTVSRCRAEQTQPSRDDVLSVLELRRLLGVDQEVDLGILDQCFGYELLYTHRSAGSASYAYDHSDAHYTDTGTYSETRDVGFSASIPFGVEPGGTTYGGTAALPFTSSTWSAVDHNHSNKPLAYPLFCDATITDTLTSEIGGTLVASGFMLGDTISGKVTLVGLSDSWHHDWEDISGPCGSVVEDYVENAALDTVGQEHTLAGDGVKYTYAPGTGRLVAVALDLTKGWVMGSPSPGSLGVVATRSISGQERDLMGKTDIPFTDTFQILKTTR